MREFRIDTPAPTQIVVSTKRTRQEISDFGFERMDNKIATLPGHLPIGDEA
jgi:hypothetical protein